MKKLPQVIFLSGLIALAAGATYLVGTAQQQAPLNEPEVMVTTPTSTPSGEMTGETAIPSGNPSFAWSFTPTANGDIPRTEIRITATYPGGATRTQRVDEIEGGCNEYNTRDADAYAGADMIICYYAGLGRYYKVVESEDGYLVQRKEFEEASPDYDPPVQPYETVVRF